MADLSCRYVDLSAGAGKGGERERRLCLRNLPEEVAAAAAALCKPY